LRPIIGATTLCDAKLILDYSTLRAANAKWEEQTGQVGGARANIQVEISISSQSDGNGAPTEAELTAAATSCALFAWACLADKP